MIISESGPRWNQSVTTTAQLINFSRPFNRRTAITITNNSSQYGAYVGIGEPCTSVSFDFFIAPLATVTIECSNLVQVYVSSANEAGSFISAKEYGDRGSSS